MAKRNPLVVFLLTCVTCFIYGFVWFIQCAREMRARGAEIPHGILLFIPIVNLYWEWTFSKGVEKVTAGKTSGVLAFILLLFLGPIGMAILQSSFNDVA